MKLTKKVLTSILIASVAVAATQCGKDKSQPKNKKIDNSDDSLKKATINFNCPACGMG